MEKRISKSFRAIFASLYLNFDENETQNSEEYFNFILRNYPNNAAASSPLGPFTITSSTEKIDTRARARAIALTVSNTAVDTNWKLGTFRLDIQTGGRR